MESLAQALPSLATRRLLMVAHANSAHTGRWARYFQELGMTVMVISPVPQAIAGVDVRFFPDKMRWYHRLKGLHLYIDYPRWRSLFAEFRPDITHVHYPDGGGRNRFYFNGIKPLITSTWGSEVIESPGYELSEKHKQGVRKILGQSDVITATGPFLAKWTTRYCAAGTPIHIIPFGVDCSVFTPAPAPRPADGTVRIGFFKNLERKYGPDVLVEAFALIAAQAPQARLTICGKGDMTDALKQRVNVLGLSDKVEFPGRLPHGQVLDAMRACDIMVNASSMQESFGVAMLEAAACELPVVITRVGGFAEVAIDEQTGLTVPSEDPRAMASACLKLIRDPQLRRSYGRAGRQFVLERYQWKNTAGIMADLYAQVLAGKTPRTPNMITA